MALSSNQKVGLLVGGATALFFFSRANKSEENKSVISGGGGSGRSPLLILPSSQGINTPTVKDTGLPDVGIGEKSESATKKQLSELESQYTSYKEDLLSTPVSSKTYSGLSFSNQTKKGEATASYKTTTETKITTTLGGENIVTKTKKEEKIPGTEWKVEKAEKQNAFQKIGNFTRNIFNEVKSTGRLGSIGNFLRGL